MCIKEIIKAIIKKPVEEILSDYTPLKDVYCKYLNSLSNLEYRVNNLNKDTLAVKNFLLKMSKNLNKEQLKELFYDYRHERLRDLPIFLQGILLKHTHKDRFLIGMDAMFVGDYLDFIMGFEEKKGKKK